jgi:hypothetical protein
MSKLGGNKLIETIFDMSLNDSKETQNRQIERSIIGSKTDNGKTEEINKSESYSVSEKTSTPSSKAETAQKIGTQFVQPILHGVDHVKSEYTTYTYLHR